MRYFLIALLATLGVAVVLRARPSRWEVDGLSMAPGLLPGDVVESGWFPGVDQLRGRHRHDRWIVQAPDGTASIKRLVGLPGERIVIEAGDLEIDGVRVLTPPNVLVQVAATVAAGCEQRPRGVTQLRVPGPIFDDAAFAPQERRLLLPVRDIGIAAVIDVQPHPAASARVVLTIGDRAAAFTPRSGGRFALAAGRLDGQFVAAAWQVEAGGASGKTGHNGLPVGAPAEWSVARPWADEGKTADPPPLLECRVESGAAAANITVAKLSVWRDMLHRPAADGNTAWRLGPHEVFLLGDFPSASRDSRHWGPVAAPRLLQRIDRAQPPAARLSPPAARAARQRSRS